MAVVVRQYLSEEHQQFESSSLDNRALIYANLEREISRISSKLDSEMKKRNQKE